MFRRISISLGIVLLLAGSYLQAQPHIPEEEEPCEGCPPQLLQELGPPDDPPPPETTPVPISGIEILLGAGILYGVKTIWKRKAPNK